jgi:hypothetical protein
VVLANVVAAKKWTKRMKANAVQKKPQRVNAVQKKPQRVNAALKKPLKANVVAIKNNSALIIFE